MVETIWETPLPYLAVGGPVGAFAAAARRQTSPLVDRLSLAGAIASIAILGTLELGVPTSLTSEQILVLSFAASAGVVVGYGVAAVALRTQAG